MRRYQWLSLLFVALVGAGCVLSASEEVAPTTVGDAATWTLTPSETEMPPPTETPTPVSEEGVEANTTAEVTAEVVVTEEAAALLQPTERGAGANVITQTAIPTATPSPTDTATPTSTATATATNTATATLTEAVSALIQEGTAVAQDDTVPLGDPAQQDPAQQQGGDGQITDNEATATQIIANATNTAEFILTETAIAAGVGDVTDTPVPQPTIPLDDGLGSGIELTPTVDAGQPPANIAPGADCIHEVRQEDRSLYRLSLAYGVPILTIARASGITNPDLIRVGQRLTIPGCGVTGGVPPATSTPGPTGGVGGGIGGPGGGIGVTPPNGDCTWGTSVVFPGGCPPLGGTGGSAGTGGDSVGTGGPGVGNQTVHIVAQGETLFEISLRYGVPIESIAAANGIANYNNIAFNQQLVIPFQ